MRETLHLNNSEKHVTDSDVTIHSATVDDVDKLVDYGENFWRETRYFQQGIEYDTETVTNMTHQLIDEGVVLYGENDSKEVVALMLVIIAPFLMNAHYLAACEWVFYVDPEYRRSGLGVQLMNTAEALLREKEVKYFTMVSLTNVTPDTANRLYERLGFEHTETNYTKDISWQQ